MTGLLLPRCHFVTGIFRLRRTSSSQWRFSQAFLPVFYARPCTKQPVLRPRTLHTEPLPALSDYSTAAAAGCESGSLRLWVDYYVV